MRTQNSELRPVQLLMHQSSMNLSRVPARFVSCLGSDSAAGGGKHRDGSALIIVVLSLVILATLGLGLLSAAYGVRHSAIRLKNEAAAMLAAEAGYERAIYWMGQQVDMLSALQDQVPGTSGTLNFPGSSCDYQIKFYAFVGHRPAYQVVSAGYSGVFARTVDVLVLQAISGWDMGMCRVPLGMKSTCPVSFVDGEIIDMPLHINKLDDSPDQRDIYMLGSPEFLRSVSMGESRHTDGGYDKYSSVIDLFDGGICFDQPDSRIMDEAAVQRKVERFEDSTKKEYTFKPTAMPPLPSPHAAVQLEFFVEDGVGKVRITNDCTVRGYQRVSDYMTFDYKIKPGSSPLTEYIRYDIYSYHYMPADADKKNKRSVHNIEETYVSQSFGGVESEPGGQIFVDGDVIIGGDKSAHNGDQVVKGRITVVATGNIWIGDSVVVDGPHEADGKPSIDNPNILGLVTQGVIKVVDPGMSSNDQGGINNYPGPPPPVPHGEYVPIGRYEGDELYERYLPDPTVVEAALTVGGGGWGVENIARDDYGGRKQVGGDQDRLIVRGAITESIRGIVGLTGKDGYLKHYYFDERLLEGILPGDMWLCGKYIPAPAGWRDYRPED